MALTLMNNKFMKYILYICAAALLTTACNEETKQTKETKPSVDTVNVFTLKDTSISKKVELPAELNPYEQSVLLAKVQGYVKDMKVDIGDHVRKGQVLAIIDAPEMQTNLASYQTALHSAKAKYLTDRDLYERMLRASEAKTPGIVAPVDLVRSRNQLTEDSAAYEAAKQTVQSYKDVTGYLVIQAPYDGIVTERKADRGSFVGNGQPLLVVQNNSMLRLRIAVPEIYTAVELPQKNAQFKVDAYPGQLFTATLARKSGSIDPATRTEQWEFIYTNKDNLLKAGSFAYLVLNMQRQGSSFVVPSTAIVSNQERKFVIRVKDGTAEWVDVRQGLSTEKGIEVFGTLQAGDTIVTRASDERKQGSTAYWKKQ
jgi:RND family efflux transporter MFP subunit